MYQEWFEKFEQVKKEGKKDENINKEQSNS